MTFFIVTSRDFFQHKVRLDAHRERARLESKESKPFRLYECLEEEDLKAIAAIIAERDSYKDTIEKLRERFSNDDSEAAQAVRELVQEVAEQSVIKDEDEGDSHGTQA